MISCVPAMNYLFKVSNWSTRVKCENFSRLRVMTLERCEWRHSSVFIVNCEHISSFALIGEFEKANVLLGSYWKKKFLKIISGLSCVILQYFQCEQNLLTNHIWTYTITTLLVNQWKIFAKELTSDVDSG